MLHYWESTSHLLSQPPYCKRDAYANKSASLLTVTAEVARFEHSGATHIIHRSYHVQDHVCITCICRSTYR